LYDLVTVLGVPFEISFVVGDCILQVAFVHVSASDIIKDVGMWKDVVSLLELVDPRVIVAVGDLGHTFLEVCSSLSSLVGKGGRGPQDQGAEREYGNDAFQVS
jgi:hypothetical protein